MVSRRWLRPAALLLTAACAAPPPPPAVTSDLLSATEPAFFPPVDTAQVGVEPLSATAGLRKGDRCIYGFHFRNGENELRWLLELELLDPEVAMTGKVADGGTFRFPLQSTYAVTSEGKNLQLVSRRCKLRLRVRDEHGAELGTSILEMPGDFLAIGLGGCCGAAKELSASKEHSLAIVTRYAGPLITLIQFLTTMQADKALSPLMWQVVEKPSLWSLITSFGVDVTLALDPESAARIEKPPEQLAHCGPLWNLPTTLKVNGAPALYCQFLAGPGTAPLTLTGGLLGAEGRHPSDPERWFKLLLLGAHRGPEPAQSADPPAK